MSRVRALGDRAGVASVGRRAPARPGRGRHHPGSPDLRRPSQHVLGNIRHCDPPLTRPCCRPVPMLERACRWVQRISPAPESAAGSSCCPRAGLVAEDGRMPVILPYGIRAPLHRLRTHGGAPVARRGTSRKSMVLHYSVRGADRAREVRGPFNW